MKSGSFIRTPDTFTTAQSAPTTPMSQRRRLRINQSPKPLETDQRPKYREQVTGNAFRPGFYRPPPEDSNEAGMFQFVRRTNSLSRCQENRCTFVADWYWGWCLDTGSNSVRIVDIRMTEIKEYSCRDEGDCLNIQYDIQNDFKCQNGRCVARNADRHWRLIDYSDPKYSDFLEDLAQPDPVYENVECNDLTARCPGIIRGCGFQGGMSAIQIGRSPAYTSPISAQFTRRNACKNCSKTTCPPSRPCKRGGKCSVQPVT